MSTIKLENVLALNEEIAALAELGGSTKIAIGVSDQSLAGQLRQINNSLETRAQLGQPLLDAATESQELPEVYRNALEVGLRSGQLSTTLDTLSQQASAEGELRSTITRSLIPPLIVSMLAYVGFIILCLYYLPTVESMYAQFDSEPGSYTKFLIALRKWLPYWVPLLPLLLLTGALLWRSGLGRSELGRAGLGHSGLGRSRPRRFGVEQSGRRGWRRFIPGTQHYTAAVHNANFAQQLALLVESGVSLADSLPVAAAVTRDADLISAAKELSAAHAQEKKLATNSESLRALPPLLRWALTDDLGEQSLPDCLRFAEKTYRCKAERRAETWRFVLPTIISAVLGGIVVLAYGLSLFGPFVQLLQQIAF